MNRMPYAKPIEFHVSFPPDFNGLWFWLLAPVKGPELSVLGGQGGLERQFPELFSASGTARLLRRLGLARVLELPSSGVIVCSPCQGSLVATVPLSQPQSLSPGL